MAKLKASSPCLITSLHEGMNLRDEPINAQKGETGVTIGCDFSKLGQVRPVRESSQALLYSTDIQHAEICYIGNTKYYFTTHASGLYYRIDASPPILIDANFIGTFKAHTINNEYVVFMNTTYCRKWKPGWTTTYMWGLNTPPTPTVAAATVDSKTIDIFTSLTDWASSGGGGGGALAADTVNYLTATQSMKLTLDSGTTIVASKTASLDLSFITAAGDTSNKSYITLSYYTADLTKVNAIRILLSCASGGGFTKDFYEYRITLGGYVYATLSIDKGEATPIIIDEGTSYKLTTTGGMVREEYDPIKKVIRTYTQGIDQLSILTSNDISTDYLHTQSPEIITEAPLKISQYGISTDARRIFTASGAWTTLKIPTADFIRYGSTSGRDWSTISALRLEVESVGGQAIISFDDWYLKGTGNLWGYYRVAVAYMNELGNYGPYSEFSEEVYLEAQKLAITGLTIDTDAQTTKRRLAILGGSIVQPMVYTLENNTATTYDFNETESSLEQVEVYFNNKPPIPGLDFEEAFGRVFIVGMPGYQNRVAYSEASFYEGFPLKNYKSTKEGEQLKQVTLLGDTITLRGQDREYLLQLIGANHTTWRITDGAREGAATPRLLLDLGKAQVYAAPTRLYMSAGSAGVEGGYLDKINPVISSYSTMMGVVVGEKGYLYFQDIDGVDRVLRIDYSLNKPVANYLMNLKPVSIMPDNILGRVYYAYGPSIYQFEGGTGPLPTSLTILHQYCENRKQKTFGPLMSYELDNGPLVATFRVDRQDIDGSYTVPTATAPAEPLTLPNMIGRGMEMTLTSTTQDYILYLPVEIEGKPVGI